MDLVRHAVAAVAHSRNARDQYGHLLPLRSMRKQRPSHALIIVLYAALDVGGAGAQVRTMIVDAATPSCDCTIELRQLVHVRDDETSPWMSEHNMFSRDARARFFGSSPWMTPGVVHAFDGNGRILHRFGREGSGPGEGRRVAPPVFGPGDTAYVYDAQELRLSVWSPEGRFVRTVRVPGQAKDWVVTSAGIVVNAHVGSRESAGLPLHLLSSSDGSVLRSFGSTSPGYRYDLPALNTRAVASASNGDIWSADQTRYRIERWTTDGVLGVRIERNVDWFPAWTGRRAEDDPGGNYITAIWADENGMLWIVINTPDPDWRTGRAQLRETPMGRVVSNANRHLTKDIVIEVIDPQSGRLVASRRFDEFYMTLGKGHPLARYQETEERLPSYVLYEPYLAR